MPTIDKDKRRARARQNAKESFEAIMEMKLQDAQPRHIESWMSALRERGLAIATCRTYLSHIRQELRERAAKVKAPAREIKSRREITLTEIKTMLSVVKPVNREWFACLLLAGPEVLDYEWGWLYDAKHVVPFAAYKLIVEVAKRRGYNTFQMNYYGHEDAHWVGGFNPRENIFQMDSHEVNRRLKSIARSAGMGTSDINVTTLKHAHIRLIEKYQDADKAAKALGIDTEKKPAEKPERKNWQLHGIGRRSSASPVMAKA